MRSLKTLIQWRAGGVSPLILHPSRDATLNQGADAPRSPRSSRVLCWFVLTSCVLAVAADWPQWRGPDRSGVSKETGLLQKWPKDGPELAWTFENTGTGFGSCAVVGGRVYVLGARPADADGDKRVEQIIALDDTGRERWKADIGPMYYFEGNRWSGGPNSTPTVDGDLVFALGSQGMLVCVKADDGAEVWRKDLVKEFGAEISSGGFGPARMGWGFSWSPLVDGDRLICTPGGPKGLFVALNKTSGKVVWHSAGLTDPCTYSSPIVAEVNGVRQYIALTQTGVVGVSAKDGSTLWEHRRDNSYPDVVCPTPICKDDFVYVSAWKAGCTLLKLAPDGGKFRAEVVYDKKEIGNCAWGRGAGGQVGLRRPRPRPVGVPGFRDGGDPVEVRRAGERVADIRRRPSLLSGGGRRGRAAGGVAGRLQGTRPVHATETLGAPPAERQGLDASGRQRRAVVRARSGTAVLL